MEFQSYSYLLDACERSVGRSLLNIIKEGMMASIQVILHSFVRAEASVIFIPVRITFEATHSICHYLNRPGRSRFKRCRAVYRARSLRVVASQHPLWERAKLHRKA